MSNVQNGLLAGVVYLNTDRLNSDVNRVNQLLGQIGQGATANINALTTQFNNLSNAMRNAQTGSSSGRNAMPDSLRQMQDAYRILNQSVREYNNAFKVGNREGADYWRNSVVQSRLIIENLRYSGAAAGLNANEQRRWYDYINMSETAYAKFNQRLFTSEKLVDNLAGAWDNIYNKVKMIVAASVAKQWKEALEYAKEFDKAITDIAIVTQQPIENVRAMASEYRSLASELQVTSTSLATAAATIYRQGETDDRAVKGIIKGVSKFGAVTDLSTDQAIDVMTASMQNFKTETESTEEVVNRIGDAWSYMGDAVATEGADIAEAMSKASASVKSVGLEFERASAYAAIMLAKTQQSGQVIGTQLNSLVSRYSKITSTGFKKITEDDEGEALSFNDVSKALKEANIEIYDSVTSTFMPMGKMLDELSEKWGTLSESQQRYIATAVSGTRGMNYFLTLMENYQDAMDLEKGAEANRGIVDEKYQIWLEGVEAAQNDMKNSLEELYAVLEADTITSFYHNMSSLIDVFTGATEAVDGWNIKAAAGTGAVIVFASAIAKLIKTISVAKEAGKAFSIFGMLSSGNIGTIVAVVGLAITAIGALSKALKEPAINLEEYREKMESFQDVAGKYDNLTKSLENLGGATNTAVNTSSEFLDIRSAIVANSPALQAAYGKEGEKIASVADAYAIVTEEAIKARKAAAEFANSMKSKNIESFNDSMAELYSRGMDDIYSFAELGNLHYTNWNSGSEYSKFTEYVKTIDGFVNDKLTLVQLQKYEQELTSILTSDTFKSLPMEDQLYTAASEMYSRIQALMIAKNDEIAGLKTTLHDILLGTSADWHFGGVFHENTTLTEALIGSFIPDDITGIDVNALSADFAEYLDIIHEAMADGLTMKESFVASDLKNRLKESGYDVAILEAIIGAYDKASWTAADLADAGSKIASDFMNAILNGKFISSALDAFNSSISNMSGDDISYQIETLMENMLGMSNDKDAQFNWAITINPNIDTGEGNIKEAVSFYDRIFSAEMAELEKRFEDGYTGKEAAILNKMRKILDVSSGTTFESLFPDANISDVITAYEQMESMIEALSALESGEFSADMLNSLIEDFPELSSAIGDTEATTSALNACLVYLTETYRDLFEALGLIVPKQESFSEKVEDAISPMSSAQKALKKLNKEEQLSVDELSDLVDEYPELAKAVDEYADNTKDATKLIDALNDAHNSKAIEEWADGVESALDSLDDAEAGTREYSKTMKELGNLFGAQHGDMDGLEFATQNLENIKAAANGSVEAFRALQEAAFINVVGTSSVDFSAVTNGLALVGDQAVTVGNLLAATGMGTVEYKELNGNADVLRYENGIPIIDNIPLNGKVAIWKPSSNNPFSKGGYGGGGKSGGGGGGGGGGGSGNVSVSNATKKLIDNMGKTHDAYDNKLELLELRREYHEIRGEIQGVIEYTKAESDVLVEQNKVLEGNIKNIEDQIKAKEATMAKNKSSSKAYKQAAADLDELNEVHAEYSKLLLENKNRIEEIVKELKEFEEEARQTVISVQELIRETLEGHDEHLRSMLDGTVDLEDTILEAIRVRYEREQELIIETAELKKEAIQDEIEAIDELIEARKKLLEDEEKAEEIAELEAKIARIAADPTRRKELLDLQKDLATLRKEQAWETYEEEMNAQKESLEDQITNLDDYIEYVNEYYEELFKNPEKLIAEMKEIIGKTDTEIIEWLKKNHEEFSSYTEAKQEQMIQDWQKLVDQMRGVTETYHDEIDEIMSWTDEEIIEWLKKYNVEFQAATEEQRESFLHSWKVTFNDWRNAYKDVATDISSTSYSSGSSSGGGSGGGGGGGGGGSSSGGGGTSTPKSYSGKAAFKYKLQGGGWSSEYSATSGSTSSQSDATNLAAKTALKKAKSAASSYYQSKLVGTALTTALNKISAASISSPGSLLKRAYKTGGLAFETGPAWLDGTPTAPERVLSAYQTQLFEDMIKTLHEIKQVRVGGISSMKAPEYTNGGGGFNIESITIHVDSLNDDTDFEELADKVGEVIMEKVTRTMSIGGITL